MTTAFQSGAFQDNAFQIDSGGGVNYTLSCAAGSYTVTGKSATLKVSHSLTCAVGSYVITGQAATLKVSHSLSCAVGAYSITGQSATFNSSHSLTASAGAYSITGKDATLTYTPGSGSIAYTLSCAAGSYLINGQNALLFYTNNGVDTHDGWKKPKKPREWKDDRPALRNAILEAIDGPQAAEAVEVIAEYIKPTKSAYTPLATRIDWTALYRQADQVMAAIERLQDDEDHELFMMML